MEKRQLESYIEQGMSQRQIADVCKKSQTSVRYWLHKYGLSTNTESVSYCKQCGKELFSRVRGKKVFCDTTCSGKYRIEQSYEKLLRGEHVASRTLRNVLFYKKEHRCEMCKRSLWEGSEIPLVVDHIDGNPSNNFYGNLRLVCCNCDAQLPTYKGRNLGHGRHSCRERYKNGLRS